MAMSPTREARKTGRRPKVRARGCQRRFDQPANRNRYPVWMKSLAKHDYKVHFTVGLPVPWLSCAIVIPVFSEIGSKTEYTTVAATPVVKV